MNKKDKTEEFDKNDSYTMMKMELYQQKLKLKQQFAFLVDTEKHDENYIAKEYDSIDEYFKLEEMKLEKIMVEKKLYDSRIKQNSVQKKNPIELDIADSNKNKDSQSLKELDKQEEFSKDVVDNGQKEIQIKLLNDIKIENEKVKVIEKEINNEIEKEIEGENEKEKEIEKLIVKDNQKQLEIEKEIQIRKEIDKQNESEGNSKIKLFLDFDEEYKNYIIVDAFETEIFYSNIQIKEDYIPK